MCNSERETIADLEADIDEKDMYIEELKETIKELKRKHQDDYE